jgi:YidC/Oxa1 family membrane protein insertase
VVLFAGLSAPVLAETLTVTAGNSEIVFDKRTGVPQRWVVCDADCGSAATRRSVLMDEGDGYFRVTTPAGPGGVFSASVQDETDAVVVNFQNAHGSYIYRLFRDSARVTVLLPPFARLDVATGARFIPEQLPGFGQIYSHVTGAQVSNDGQDLFDDPDDGPIELIAEAGNWTGIRSRYWALLFNPAGAATATLDLSETDRPQLQLATDSGDQSVVYEIYAGPVEWQSLKTVAPVLSEMLFGALWDFLRVLCFGMLILLGWLQSATGSFGLAIILLSLTVKVLMSPLTMIADRWQADVNRQLTLIKPELDEIKKNYKGEEAHMRVLAVYKKHGVSQLYTFKSAAGFLIQIPIFIAAFDMLAENFALNDIAFLWINDLAKPDRLVELPFALPFFGGWLNLLPFIMTGLSVLSARLQSEATLSADLQRQQSTRLYLMSTAFFVLFYTFPAGMVLYWTSSNLFHLLKVESGKMIVRFRRGSR